MLGPLYRTPRRYLYIIYPLGLAELSIYRGSQIIHGINHISSDEELSIVKKK